MSTILTTNRAFDTIIDSQMHLEFKRKQEEYALTQTCKLASDAVADKQFEQGKIQLTSGSISATFQLISALATLFGKTDIGHTFSVFSQTITPKATEYFTQKGQQTLQKLNFDLKTDEQSLDAKRNESLQRLIEELRQTAMRLQELYLSLWGKA